MSQSRRMSLVETATGITVGFAVSVAASFIVFPLFGHSFTLGENVGIALVFTVLSLVRGYLVRRAFNRWGRA